MTQRRRKMSSAIYKVIAYLIVYIGIAVAIPSIPIIIYLLIKRLINKNRLTKKGGGKNSIYR